MKDTASRISTFKDSVFGIISARARKNNAINLGQGSPDFDGAEWIKKYVSESMDKGQNQYAPFMGIPHLRESISKLYKDQYNLNHDPETEISITNGATEGIFISILSLVNPGDEVIVFEPFYDSYVATIEMAGGIPVPVTLRAPDFSYDPDELTKAFSDKTKLVILNTPHNPTGKIFNRTEMQFIADLVLKYDTYVISDEVYEFLIFDGKEHLPFINIEGMRERTLTLSSAGKTFGFTGWKIGWILAPEKLSKNVRMIHQYNTFSCNTPMQHAVARGIDEIAAYLEKFKADYLRKRNILFDGLTEIGFKPYKPYGTYFLVCPIDHLTKKNDFDFCYELIDEYKVATIPPSVFYLKSDEGAKMLRFCFAKKDETLKEAILRLKQRV